MFTFSGIIIFYFTAGWAKNNKLLSKITNTAIMAGTLSSLYSIMQFANMDFIWGRALSPYGERSISTFGNPNFLSSYLLIIIYWIIGRIFKRRHSSFWILILIVNLAGLAITMTRSTYAALFLGLLALSYFLIKEYRKKTKYIKRITLTLIGVSAGIFMTFSIVSPQFKERVQSFFSTEKMGAALTQRVMIWEASVNMFKDTPVVGRGWGNFEIFYPFYQGEIVHREDYRDLRTHANNSHNFILELLTQVGIFGTALYIWLIVTFIIYSKKLYDKVEKNKKLRIFIFTVAGLSFWVDNLLNVSLFFPIPALAFWLNAGLLAAEGRKIEGYPGYSFNIKSFYFPGLVAILLFFTGISVFNYKYFTASSYFFQGFKYSRQGNLTRAKDKLLKAHNRYTLIVDNNYELGNVYSRLASQDKSYLENAIWAYKEAIKANPGYDEIYFNLGVMYLRNGDFKNAEQSLKSSLKINPISLKTLRTLGDLKGRQSKFNQALSYYNQALNFNSKEPYVWNNYGYYTEQSGNLKDAAERYLKALELDSDFNEARNNIRRVYSRLNNEIDPPRLNRLFNRAQEKIKKENWEQALGYVEKILDFNPLDLNALLYAGNIQYQLNNSEKALNYYQKILLINPGHQTALENIKAIKDNER